MSRRNPEHLTREAESVAPDDARGCAHGEEGLQCVAIRYIDRYLGARVSRAHNEDAPPSVRRAIPVARRMDDLAVEGPGPMRHERDVAVAGRNDDAFRLHIAAARHDVPRCGIAINALNFRAGPHRDTGALRVAPQIFDHAVSRRPLSERTRHSIARQAREPTHGVQVEPVVSGRPSSTDAASLEDDDVLALPLEHRSASKAGGPCSDHCDHTDVLHERRRGADASRELSELAIEPLRLLQVRQVADVVVPRRLGGRAGGEDVLGHRR